MKKFEEYFSIIYILGGFLIPICIVLLIYYTFVGKSYYNVSSKNEEPIVKYAFRSWFSIIIYTSKLLFI